MNFNRNFFSDLSSVEPLKQVVFNSFSHISEEVKSAASYSLGSISIGNLPQYLPFILQNIETQPKKQYLLLHSLKEVISCQSATRTGNYENMISDFPK